MLLWARDEARQQPRDFEIGRLPRRPRADERRVCYLGVDDAHAFLRAAGRVRPDMSDAFAIALFAGLRPYEICRLHAGNIHYGEHRIRVDGWQAKTRSGRNIEGIPATLWRTLGPQRDDGWIVPGTDNPTRGEDRAVYRWFAAREKAARTAGVRLR